MVAGLMISLLYARFVIPLLAAHWLGDKDIASAEKADAFMTRVQRGYARVADLAFVRPGAFALVTRCV